MQVLNKFGIAMFLVVAPAISSWAAEPDAAWRTDPQHPQLQYRIRCSNGAATIDWRNGYAGTVSFRASVKTSTYEGTEDVRVSAGGLEHSMPDTMYCSPVGFRIALLRFSISAPEPSPQPAEAVKAPAPRAPAPPAPPPAPVLLPFERETEKIPEVSLDALTSVNVGMTRDDVVRRLGAPRSKVSIPEDDALVETYRYNVAGGTVTVIRFSNQKVVEISSLR
jgi:hypothetical protein